MAAQLHVARSAGLVLLATITLAVAGCGPQDGLGAAGDPVESDGAVPSAASGLPAATGSAEAAEPGQLDALSADIGVPCPPSDPARAVVADGLPALTLDCLASGPEVTLSGLPAVPTVLNVWATWCAPCRAEMPLLADLAADAGDRVTVLGVNVLDERAAASVFAAEVPLASVYDPAGATRSELRWTGPPVTYLIDAEGRIVHRIYGQIPDAGSLRDDVAEYLGVEVPSD